MPTFHMRSVSMHLLFILIAVSLGLTASAAPRKKVRAVPAKPAVPAQPTSTPAGQEPSSQIISSEVGGRDLIFVADAIDLGKALRYLATQTPRTSNPALRGFGDDVINALASQTAVLTTVAEMRQLRIPDTESATEKRVAEKVSQLEGIKLEKALLDAFIDIDRRLVAAYELGAKSDDVMIRKFVDETLPRAREHLVLVESMAGILTKQPPASTANGSSTARKPAFRTKVPLSAEPAPEIGR
jgi:hypothetical protein